ncbi:serine threonine-protein kinase [Stagonosporopsis vannaccii]|nr:serine threonine-protein kinase [Stagonosporopsis vannaccii]
MLCHAAPSREAFTALCSPHPNLTAPTAMHLFRKGSSACAPRYDSFFKASCLPSIPLAQRRWAHAAAVAPKWKPSSALDEWVQREARPISLRQLTFFGRTLTESRLMDSANYCRLELPTRLAHRLRDIQTLPYVVVANPHLAHVYESYLQAFERFRRVPEIRSVEDNDRYCKVLEETLKEHATVIPRLAIGVLEVRNLMKPDETDKFMTTMLRARISRRVIAEQHLALTETFNSPWHFPDAQTPHDQEAVGEIFLRCNAKEIVESCGKTTQELIRHAYGAHVEIPEIKIYGHLEATFPYILSHLEYIIGELLRNSIQAVIEQRKSKDAKPPPIEVLICETSQHVIIRISDQGGGIPNDLLPYLWSFSKGPRREKRLQNLARVPKLLGTLQELQVDDKSASELQKQNTKSVHGEVHRGSLASLTSRAPDLRLGIGLPMSRLYAEYWAGSLEIHSLEGYGVDAFLEISKLGNKNERLTTRASMDAI